MKCYQRTNIIIMKKCLFTGVATALATPFNENGVNIEEFKKFIQFQISSGVNALVVCGTTGESSTMTKLLLLNVQWKLLAIRLL